MKPSFMIWSVLAAIAPLVSATALTYQLGSTERACFFTHVPTVGAKVAFYFAVQSGESFEVDYQVAAPNDRVITEANKERQGDFVFTANEVGDYRVCFYNEISSSTEKMIDFELAAENESKYASLPQKQGTSPEQTSALEESIFRVSGQLSTISRNQKYFRTRENRNFSTVRSTEKRILNLNLIESGMMVLMAGLQVFIVRFFFNGARKGYV
ncbi:MAG: hypothetical protein GOMPHAMPRED_004518 [Gomphillus americanus]|uniref:GOLD domain-containing protein n=1 Tax=Gomphillus americanus TaxID=1940652 RepID=A0A8H3IH42_9LECA|nr:MAG: hypothetical protein GOMPHAMPRED_004518 [Gomphillus americanus]